MLECSGYHSRKRGKVATTIMGVSGDVVYKYREGSYCLLLSGLCWLRCRVRDISTFCIDMTKFWT